MQSVRRRVCGLYGPTFARIDEHKHSAIGGHLAEHGLPNSALEVIIDIFYTDVITRFRNGFGQKGAVLMVAGF